jgi:hypothetical protein
MPRHIIDSFKRAILLAGLLTVFLTPSMAQTYDTFVSPNTSWTRWAYCRDINTGQIVYYCVAEIYTEYYPQTNAHLHESASHPWSTFWCADQTQCYPYDMHHFQITTSWRGSVEHDVRTLHKVGQAEKECIYADSTTCYDHVVGYNDVYYNNHEDIWLRIGGTDTGVDTGHGSTYYNRYMMSYAAYGVYDATNDYLASHSPQEKVCTNDMALPFGGKFDINQTWTSPHASHDRGTAVDVAGPGGGQCPAAYQVNVAEFIQACVNRGALSTYSVAEGNHAHVNWANPSSYAH